MKTKTIEQTIDFKGVKPKEMYDMYLSSKHHTRIINGQASINKKVGAPYKIWGGMLWGKNLMLKPGEMIVQSWRAKDWRKRDADSIFILNY